MATASPTVWNHATGAVTAYIDSVVPGSLGAGQALAVGGDMWVGTLLTAAVAIAVTATLYFRRGYRLVANMIASGDGVRLCATSPGPRDALTGLPCRLALESQLQRPNPHQGRFAILVVGMDAFRAVNEVHGHAFGDGLLKAAAGRIQAGLREGDLVVRLSGDEFAVLARVDDAGQAKTMAKRLLQRMQVAFKVSGRDIDATASVGIAIDSAAGTQRNRLLAQASAALREAKDQGRNRYCVFDASVGASTAEIELMIGDLRKALRDNELLLLYQPKLDLQSGRIVGVEALLRWNHPQHGSISPDYFIPLAEKTGMIVDVGRWVLNEACRQMRSWRNQRAADWSVAVNVSVFQINSPTFSSDICEALQRHDIDPQDLTIEVTESGAMRNAELSLMILRKLASLGVKISLDDFGVGHSSLSHLKRFPIHELKIDRSFVAGIADDAEDLAIVNAIVALAKAVDLRVVAEGVETMEQQAALAEMGCDEIQGYLISRPVMPAEVSPIVASYNRVRREFAAGALWK
jgi:diguanylate cyclase